MSSRKAEGGVVFFLANAPVFFHLPFVRLSPYTSDMRSSNKLKVVRVTVDPDNMIGSMIEQRRTAAGITRTQLGEGLGYPRQYGAASNTVWRWETGYQQPTRRKLAEILAYLDGVASGKIIPPPARPGRPAGE